MSKSPILYFLENCSLYFSAYLSDRNRGSRARGMTGPVCDPFTVLLVPTVHFQYGSLCAFKINPCLSLLLLHFQSVYVDSLQVLSDSLLRQPVHHFCVYVIQLAFLACILKCKLCYIWQSRSRGKIRDIIWVLFYFHIFVLFCFVFRSDVVVCAWPIASHSFQTS